MDETPQEMRPKGFLEAIGFVGISMAFLIGAGALFGTGSSLALNYWYGDENCYRIENFSSSTVKTVPVDCAEVD